jgi:hypothetical protein
MKHVNGDMEDLFRKAAAKYPLRTDSADWDRLAAALDRDPGPPSDTDEDDKRRRRGIFWWLILLPLGGLGYYAGHYAWHARHVNDGQGKVVTAAPAGGSGAGTHATAGGLSAGANATASAPGAGTNASDAETKAIAGSPNVGTNAPAGVAEQGNSGDVQEKMRVAGSDGTIEQTRSKKIKGPAGAGASASPGGGGLAGTNESTGTGVSGLAGASGKAGTSGPAGASGSAGTSGLAKLGGSAGASGLSGSHELLPSGLDLSRVPTKGDFAVNVDVKARAAAKDSNNKAAKKATSKTHTGHGYIGIIGAPDLSTVKMQATKGVGTTWGLLLGYSFNSHWAVESGVYLDRKKYYTAGEYFKGADQPSYPTLKSVNGSCNMWEIPLNVRYNFNPGSKITWFATAGASSYLMTKQEYYYQYEGVPRATDWSTTVHANYLFSIINLSGGFEQRIGRIGNLRIEPYVRIPLSGIGTGRLPIMSAGLNIGITRQLW